MPYENVPAFLAGLRKREAIAGLALECCTLTAARSGEVFGLRWPEVDFDKRVWTVPGERMKAGRPHRVPLTDRAIAILKEIHALSSESDFAFPGQATGRPLSSMAMEMMLRRMKVTDATVHGFRSSFRDRAGNVSYFPREFAEAALAHVIGDKSEQAYRRSDALDKRRALMEEWAAWCDSPKMSNAASFSARTKSTKMLAGKR